MLSKLFPIALFAVLFSNCTKYDIADKDLSNKDRMNQLVINDPLIWNSLANMSMEIDTTLGMKASTGMTKEKEYPKKGYYYTLFEDLFPAQGDYDFNDVVLETKLSLDGKKGEVWGTVNSKLYHRGGALSTRLGVMFYSVKGNKEYTRIENEDISINDVQLTGDEPYTMDLPAVGEEFEFDYYITDRTNNINQLWITYYIIVETETGPKEIHSSGFPSAKNKSFEIPQFDFLTLNNLPWGLVIEAEEFYIPREKALFLDAFPEFKEWAESDGKKNKEWFENPDLEFIQ